MPENVRSRNQPILRFNVILQHDWPIEQCRLHIRVFFGGKTKSPCLDLFIHWLIKQITNIGSSPGALTSLVSSRLLVKGSSRGDGKGKRGENLSPSRFVSSYHPSRFFRSRFSLCVRHVRSK